MQQICLWKLQVFLQRCLEPWWLFLAVIMVKCVSDLWYAALCQSLPGSTLQQMGTECSLQMCRWMCFTWLIWLHCLILAMWPMACERLSTYFYLCGWQSEDRAYLKTEFGKGPESDIWVSELCDICWGLLSLLSLLTLGKISVHLLCEYFWLSDLAYHLHTQEYILMVIWLNCYKKPI